MFEESKAGAIGELEKADIDVGTYDMSLSRRTVAHGSCVRSADELSVKSRHWVVVGRHHPTTVRCSVRSQVSRRWETRRRRARRDPLGLEAAERLAMAIPVLGRSILAIGLEQIAVTGLRSSGACRSGLGAQIGEAGEVRGSGVRSTARALFGFEQTVGVDFSLERRPKRLPGGLGCLARVVGRVESVCTDPPAKGPTGPFCLVHLQMHPVLP
jgi:hypothetical protein